MYRVQIKYRRAFLAPLKGIGLFVGSLFLLIAVVSTGGKGLGWLFLNSVYSATQRMTGIVTFNTKVYGSKIVEEDLLDSDGVLSTLDSLNDGVAHADPFTKCEVIPGSYVDTSTGQDVEWFDFEVPYRLSYEDVGGYATAATSTGKYSYRGEVSKKRDYKVGSLFDAENDEQVQYLASGKNYTHEGKLGIFDFAGTQLAGAALGYGVADTGCKKYGFSDWCKYGSAGSTGQLFDLIMTDGTVLHFTCMDGISTEHSNGGPSGVQDAITYSFSALNLPQYKNVYHCDKGQLLELSGLDGVVTEFVEKYNIRGDGSGNSLMYIRVYNANVADGGVKVKSQYAKFSTKMELSSQTTETVYTTNGSVDPNFRAGKYGANVTEAWNTIINYGYSPEAAAGILGNALVESGTINPASEGNGGFGIVGFTYHTLCQGLEKFCSGSEHAGHQKKYLSFNDGTVSGRVNVCIRVDCQMNYVLKNLSGDYTKNFKGSYTPKYGATAPQEMAGYFAYNYERHHCVSKGKKWSSIEKYMAGLNDPNERCYCGYHKAEPYLRAKKAQEIYDLFMAGAAEYAQRVSIANDNVVSAGGASGGSVAGYNFQWVTSEFLKAYNVDTSKMSTEQAKALDAMYWICWNSVYSQASPWWKYHSYKFEGYYYQRSTKWESWLKEEHKGADCSSSIVMAYQYAGITGLPGVTGSYPNKKTHAIAWSDAVAGDVCRKTKHVVMFLGWQTPNTKMYAISMHGFNDNDHVWGKTGKTDGAFGSPDDESTGPYTPYRIY